MQMLSLDAEPRLAQRRGIAGEALLRGEQPQRPAEEGDGPVPARDQMLRGAPRPLGVLDEHPRHLDAGNVLVEQHHVAPLADLRRQRAVVGRVGQHDQPVDMMVAQPVERGDLAAAVRARRGNEDGVAVPVRLVLHRRGQLGKERLADFRHHEADGVGLARRQSPRQQVRAIIVLGDGGVDARRGGGRQLDAVVEIARHRGLADPRRERHVVNGRHARPRYQTTGCVSPVATLTKPSGASGVGATSTQVQGEQVSVAAISRSGKPGYQRGR